jgi:hypothetical protein
MWERVRGEGAVTNKIAPHQKKAHAMHGLLN